MDTRSKVNLLTLSPEIFTQICPEIFIEIPSESRLHPSRQDPSNLHYIDYTTKKALLPAFRTRACRKLYNALSTIFFTRLLFGVLIMQPEPSNSLRK